MEHTRDKKYLRAKKRVEELKGFYIHLFVYIVVNSFISISKIISDISSGDSFSEAIFDFGTVAVWMFWGIGLVAHAMSVFNVFLGKGWEKRQIEKIMDEEKSSNF